MLNTKCFKLTSEDYRCDAKRGKRDAEIEKKLLVNFTCFRMLMFSWLSQRQSSNTELDCRPVADCITC